MSSDALALSVQGVSKGYRIPIAHPGVRSTRHSFVEALPYPFGRPQKRDFAALVDVSMEVHKGEAVGIIGQNGAGKSTLLKILSRIVSPTAGRIEIYGRLGSLLEVGTGFHPELTGRENVYLNGAILGMRKRDIARQFESIVDFAGVDRFLDTPVKRYSSGMYVRLAFAVAAHLNPDILLIDEVLSVGDAQFQKKSLGKMEDASTREGRTVLFVSHNMTSIESFCKRCIYLEEGRIAYDGETLDAIERYLSAGRYGVETEIGTFDLGQSERRYEGSSPVLRRLELRRPNGEPTGLIRMGEGLSLIVETAGLSATRHMLAIRILSADNVPIVTLNSNQRGLEVYEPDVDLERVHITIPRLPLVTGVYSIELTVYELRGGRTRGVVDRVDRAANFEVVPADVFGTGYRMPDRGPMAGTIFVDSTWELCSDGIVAAATPALDRPL